MHIRTHFSQAEIEKINSIFLSYPNKVANIARHIFDCVPYREAVYAVYANDAQPYGLKRNIIELYDKEVAKVKHLRSLPWVLLSSEEDIRSVCDFVQRHIDDGTFDLHPDAIPKDWVSLIDGRTHKVKPWTKQSFKPFTVEETDKYPYPPSFPSLDD